MRLLIVEDERVSRRALSFLLESYGYRTVLAESAEQALAILRANEAPDAILLDVDLPGLSGLELLRRLRRLAPQVVPIMVTATDRDEVETVAGSTVEHIRKPIDFNHLLQVLNQSLHSH